MYPYNVLKTFLPLVTRPCRFDQITRRKIKPRTEGSDSGHFDFHSVKEKTRGDWGPTMDDVDWRKNVLRKLLRITLSQAQGGLFCVLTVFAYWWSSE